MGLSIKFHNPAYSDGAEVGIEGLGLLKNNGEAIEITEEQEQAFVLNNRMLVKDVFENNEFFTVEGEPTVSEVPEEAQPQEETEGEEESSEDSEAEGEGTQGTEEEPANA